MLGYSTSFWSLTTASRQIFNIPSYQFASCSLWNFMELYENSSLINNASVQSAWNPPHNTPKVWKYWVHRTEDINRIEGLNWSWGTGLICLFRQFGHLSSGSSCNSSKLLFSTRQYKHLMQEFAIWYLELKLCPVSTLWNDWHREIHSGPGWNQCWDQPSEAEFSLFNRRTQQNRL